MPISFLVTWPRRQISGISQRGSALRARPTFMRNQTASPAARSLRRALRTWLARGRRLAARCRRTAPRAPAARRGSRRIRAAATASGSRSASSAVAAASSSGGSSVERARARASSRSWSLARISSAEGGADQTALDVGGGQQLLGPAAPGVGDDQHRHALAARRGRCGRCGAAGASRSFGRSAWIDQAEVGQVEAAGGDVGGDADPGTAVAQRLQRVGALVLGQLAGERHGGEAALDAGWRAGGARPRGSSRTPARRAPRSSAAR